MIRILKQLALALSAAAVVFVIVLVAAWVGLSPEPMLYRRQMSAFGQVRWFARLLNDDLDNYRKENGKAPDRVADLPFFSTDDLLGELERNANGDVLDLWGNPLQYLMAGDKVIVMSLGRNGAAGGIGPDADLYSDNRNRAARFPSFRQFVTEHDQREIFNVGVYLDAILTAGIVACTIFFKLLVESNRRGTLKLRDTVKSVGAIVTVSVVVGVILLVFHIPNGH